jgi:hypothetical protein
MAPVERPAADDQGEERRDRTAEHTIGSGAKPHSSATLVSWFVNCQSAILPLSIAAVVTHTAAAWLYGLKSYVRRQ